MNRQQRRGEAKAQREAAGKGGANGRVNINGMFKAARDLSPGMLENAGEKKIYDELERADIIEFLIATEQRYDVFTAADLFIYIGNLEPVFAAVRGAAMVDAWFAFSTEATEEADYRLNETGRYSHSKDYIELLSRKFGFEVRNCQAETIRTQSGNPVAGYLFVLQLAS